MTVRVWSFSGSPAIVRCRQDFIATCKIKAQNEHQLRRCKRFHTSLVIASSTAVAPPQVSQQATKPPQLPSALDKHVVQLTFTRHNKPVHVYILGMSHVSRESCNHTAQLIATAKPDLVLLELCKDRTGLLLDPAQLSPQYWHSRTVTLDTGAETQPASVQHACHSLLNQLRCQPGTAFSTHEIEQDCTKLLASGLFKSVVPVTQSASASDAPMFVYTANQMTTVAPLGSLMFRVTFRAIPTVKSLQLQSSPERQQADIQSRLQRAESQQPQSALHKLLDLHQQLQSAMPSSAAICYDGVETGNIKVSVIAQDSPTDASITGLEGSAKSGKGWGIQPFQHRAQLVPSLQAATQTPADSSTAARQQSGTEINPWSQQDLQQAAANISSQTDSQQKSVSNSFAAFLTTRYSRYQGEAGGRVGVQEGEAWRTALLAAAQHGASQVQLCDKPAVAMSQRMANAIWNNTYPSLAGALALGLVALAGAASHAAPVQAESLAVVGAAGLLARAALPVVGPLLEVRQLSKLSRDAIEAAVDPKEHLQDSKKVVKLWGEDALLDWPGAMEPVIHERDAHMAQAIWAAAHGTAGSPAYVPTSTQAEHQSWQYVMPKQAVDSAACPVGHGSGTFTPPTEVQSLVAIVGTAHVYGIMQHLKRLQNHS